MSDEDQFRVCVPTSDVISKNLGDGVEEILSLNGGEPPQNFETLPVISTKHSTVVPVILVATKFDLVVSEVLSDIAGGDTRLYERTRGTAHAKYEESRRTLFRGKLRDVPVEIVSSTYPLTCFS